METDVMSMKLSFFVLLKNRFKKILFLSCFIVSQFIGNNVLEAASEPFAPQPFLNLERYAPITSREVRELTEQEARWAAGLDWETLPQPTYELGVFPRLLGYSEQEIKNYILNHGEVQDEAVYQRHSSEYTFNLSNQGDYKFLHVQYLQYQTFLYYTATAIYILKQNLSIGYILMDNMNIVSEKPFPELVQILKGKKNNQISNKINQKSRELRRAERIPAQAEHEEIIIYDFEHEQDWHGYSRDNHKKNHHQDKDNHKKEYLERYGLVVDPKAKNYLKDVPSAFCLDAFYPEKLNEQAEKLILQWLPRLAYSFQPYE